MNPQILIVLKAALPLTRWALQKIIDTYHPGGFLGWTLTELGHLLGEVETIAGHSLATIYSQEQVLDLAPRPLPPHMARLLDHFPQGHFTPERLEAYIGSLAAPAPPTP